MEIVSAGAHLISDEPNAVRPGYRYIEVGLVQPAMLGDVFTLEWRERLQFRPPDDPYANFFVGVEAHNDHYELTMRILFEGTPPIAIWCFKSQQTMEPKEVGPELGEPLTLDPDGRVSHTWTDTDRRVSYCVRWTW
jgi:hypothetical protein